jgi:hypothetical protein
MTNKIIGVIISGIFTTLVLCSCSVNHVQRTITLDEQASIAVAVASDSIGERGVDELLGLDVPRFDEVPVLEELLLQPNS